MKIAVFCFYNPDGRVYDYVTDLIKSIGTVADSIDIIVNGDIEDEGYAKLSSLARRIYIRQNEGYDAGAYAQYFNEWADEDEIRGCDQLILANDTVFGPYTAMTDIFERMAAHNCDFWGIRKVDRNAFAYLESFFLVFNHHILEEGEPLRFFKENSRLQTAGYKEVLSLFERGMYAYLKQLGYKDASYVDMPYYDIFYSSDYCMIKGGYPFLKKKCLNTYMYGRLQMDMIIDHITGLGYDERQIVDFIRENYDPLYEPSGYSERARDEKLEAVVHLPYFEVSERDLIGFFSDNPSVYIYGAGYYASIFYCVYKPYIKELKGFIVSNPQNAGGKHWDKPVVALRDVPEGSAVMVALDRANAKEVKDNLGNRYNCIYLWK